MVEPVCSYIYVTQHSCKLPKKACLQDPQLFLVTITLHPPGQQRNSECNCALVYEDHSLTYVDMQDLSSMMLMWNTSVISDIRTA